MESAKFCDIGNREINEDYALTYEQDGNGLYVVADGLGGHNCGEVASKTAAETVLNNFAENSEASSLNLLKMIKNAQKELLRLAEVHEYNGMRTTLVTLVVSHKTVVWGHIGDSRLYGIHDGKIQPMTADHSVAYISYMSGEIGYDDIRKSPDQNRLIRSMGSSDKFKPDIAEPVDANIGDAFLLCTDGFWEYISEKEILSAYKKSSSASRWLAKMVRIVEKNSKNNTERDNCTAVAVFI